MKLKCTFLLHSSLLPIAASPPEVRGSSCDSEEDIRLLLRAPPQQSIKELLQGGRAKAALPQNPACGSSHHLDSPFRGSDISSALQGTGYGNGEHTSMQAEHLHIDKYSGYLGKSHACQRIEKPLGLLYL